MIQQPTQQVVKVSWMPTEPPVPAPAVMTADEVIVYLRISKKPTKVGRRTLQYYRREGHLMGVRVGRSVVYTLDEVNEFLRKRTEAGIGGAR